VDDCVFNILHLSLPPGNKEVKLTPRKRRKDEGRMNKFKLTMEEEVRHAHEIIIETELTEDELGDVLEEMDFDDAGLQDAAAIMEKNEDIKVVEIIENDPVEWGIECTDIQKAE
jgi:hypothetical protein